MLLQAHIIGLQSSLNHLVQTVMVCAFSCLNKQYLCSTLVATVYLLDKSYHFCDDEVEKKCVPGAADSLSHPLQSRTSNTKG